MSRLAYNTTGAVAEGATIEPVFAGRLYLSAAGTFTTATIRHRTGKDDPWVDLHTFGGAGVTSVEVPSGQITLVLDATAANATVVAEQ